MPIVDRHDQLFRLRWNAPQFTDNLPDEDVWCCQSVDVARKRAATFSIDGVIEVSDDGHTWTYVERVRPQIPA